MARDVDILDVSNLIRENGDAVNIEQYTSTLWAVEESSFFAQYEAMLRMDLAAHVRSGQARTNAGVSEPDRSGIVRIDISGTMTKQGSSLSGAGSTLQIRRAVRQAKNDPNVEAVLLVIESPGGSVAGTADLGTDIAELSAVKPTMTYADDLMASAALWVGLQTRKVYANTANAIVGSMGVFIGLYDMTGAAAMKGIKPVVIKTGELKGAGFPGSEITEAQKAMWQNLADQSLAEFQAAITKNRKFTAEQMTEILRAGVYPAQQAIGLGLIDGIRSIDAAVAELRSMIPTKRKSGLKMADELPQAATLGQLKAACDGAGSEFFMKMIEQSASVDVARDQWSRQQNASILDLNSKLTEANAKIVTLNSEAASVKTAHDAVVADLNVKLATAEAKANAKTPFVPVGGGSGKSGSGDGGSAQDKWMSAKASLVTAGMSASEAVQHLVKTQPELHAAYVAEANIARV